MRLVPITVVLASCFYGVTTTTTSGTPTSSCASGVIGASGGALEQAGVVLTVPAGALPIDTSVVLCTDGPAPAGLVPASVVVEITPSTAALAAPAELTLPHSGGADAVAWATAADGTLVRQLRALDVGGSFSMPLYRFGTAVVAPDPRLLEPYVEVPEPADLLFVVDNSCSMFDEQQALAENFPEGILDPLVASGIDFHVGVVSTDIDAAPILSGSNGHLVVIGGARWVEPATIDPATVFDLMVSIGTTGSGSEKGLGATYQALEIEGDVSNVGFVRPEARLGVVVVSDEPDSTPASMITEPEFVDWFLLLKADPDDVGFHGIVSPAVSDKYLNASADIGGITHDISDRDWLPTLSSVVDSLLDLSMPLAASAVSPWAGEVWLVPADGSEPWLVDPASVVYDPVGNTVTVDLVVDPGDELVVLYLPS